MKILRKLTVVISVITLLLVSSCTRSVKQDVLMLYPNWAEGIAVTHLAKVVLEEQDYTVSLKRLEPGPIYAALYKSEADVCLDAWLPYTHQDYWARYESGLDIVGVIFDSGTTGLVVPTYVDINSIEELNTHKEQFSSKIFGIGTGAGIHANTEKAIEDYVLDYKQISSSETSMITALKRAVSKDEWIVITGWKPHFMWSQYDLKTLEDPQGIYPTDEITIVSRKGFKEDQPAIAGFFEQFKLSEEMLYELMDEVAKDQDPHVGARSFYENHKDLLLAMLPIDEN